MQVALVLSDDHAHVAAGILFHADGFPLNHVLVTDLAADLRKNGDAMRVPLAEDRAGLDLLILVYKQVGAGGDLVFFQLAAFGVQ